MVKFDVKQLINRIPAIIDFQKQNGRLPNYVTLGNDKIDKKEYVDALNRVSQFTVKEDRLPYTVQVQTEIKENNTPSTVYISPRFKHYVDQDTKYYCAPFMLAQIIFELFNIIPAQTWLASRAGTTTKGTGHTGVIKALNDWCAANGHKVISNFQGFSSTGWQKCAEMIKDPNVGLGFHVKYRNKFGHYMYPVIVDMDKKIVTCIDSLNPEDLITVSFTEFESWIRNTTGGQPSCFVVKKIK